MSDDAKAKLDEIHEQGKELGRNGKAFVLTAGSDDSAVYWDEETGKWLYGNSATEKGWVMLSGDEFPNGLELMVSWGDYKVVPVEETKLYHNTYGLDQARDGYGIR